MGRAVNPPYSLELALLAALGFGACMPSEVEVGRDATLEVQAEAGAGGQAHAARSSGGTGDAGMVDGGEPGAPSAGGATSAGGSRPGGHGGVAGMPSAGSGGSAAGAAGSAVVPSGGTGGRTSPVEIVCPVPGSQEAEWSLEMFCSRFTCPTSADGAKDLLARSFEGCPGVANEVRTGCGRLQVSVTTETQSDTYVYADDTRALVGATIHNDKPWGPCNVFRYYAGLIPSGCQADTACAFCGEMATCP